MSKVRVGVIGYGKMGMLHGAIISGLKDAELVAVADTEKIVTGFLSKLNPNIKIYTDYNQMLEKEEIDAVFITTPVNRHYSIAMDCANQGVHFFCEKPLTTNGKLAENLSTAVREHDVVSMVGHMMRYNAIFSKGKQILADSPIGDLITFNASIFVGQLFKKGKGWRYSKEESGGGVLMNQGSHLLDIILWYFGNVKSVYGRLMNPYSTEVEDFVYSSLSFESGLTGILEASWSKRHHRLVDTTISIEGTEGTLEITDDAIKLFVEKENDKYPIGWTVLRKPDLFQGVPFDVGGPEYTMEDIAFLDAVRNKIQLDSDVDSAVNIHKVIDSIYESSEKNEVVHVLG